MWSRRSRDGKLCCATERSARTCGAQKSAQTMRVRHGRRMMPVAPEVVLAFRSLSRHRLRTFLMMSGVIVGVASLTVVNSIGEATKQEALKRFKNMVGTFDTITIRPGAGRTRGMVSLTNVPATLKFEDAQAMAAEVPSVKQVAELQNAFDVDVKY